MSRIVPDGNIKVHVVDSISTKAAPTVAEIAAGTEVTGFITPAGIDTPEEGNEADSSDLGSVRDKSIPSTVGGQITAEFYRDDGTGGFSDDAWTALPKDQITHLVIARFGGSGTDKAIIATDSVEVWQGRVSSRSNNRAVRGEALRFTMTFGLSADVVDATVAA